nr:hypothetical protein [Rhizobium sp. CIAT894]
MTIIDRQRSIECLGDNGIAVGNAQSRRKGADDIVKARGNEAVSGHEIRLSLVSNVMSLRLNCPAERVRD